MSIAILGYGNIGSGVLSVLRKNATEIAKRAGGLIEVKYVLDIRDFSKSPDAKLFVNNIDVILEDKSIDTVVETMGGTNPAYFYVKSALMSGKNVCTSNKELVATHGAELLLLAKNNNVAFLFEASVGGGMPLIGPMHKSLSANIIESIYGIVNGTTNFMLTKMDTDGVDFSEALSEAQALGYAETVDPSADVDGIDAGRKIAILASLVYGTEIHPDDIPAKGIRDITTNDINFAKHFDMSIKLIAYARKNEIGEFCCAVEPMLIKNENRLAGVSDVFNAVMICGDLLGDVMFYGKGAGKLPTASAVVADIIDATRFGSKLHDTLFWQPSIGGEKITDNNTYTYYIRVETKENQDISEFAPEKNKTAISGNEVAFISPLLNLDELNEFTEKLSAAKILVKSVIKTMP